jgi:hypothetical protein
VAISIVGGVDVAGDDPSADLLQETDPALFSFMFGDLLVSRRLFPEEGTASCSTQQDDETRVALAGNRPVRLINSFAGAEVATRFSITMERQLLRWIRAPPGN